MTDSFDAALRAIGVELRDPAKTLARFETYAAELARANEVMNLTSEAEPERIFLRHFADSLAASRAFDARPASLIDVGCGAGFPGLPLKLLADDAEEGALCLTLLDATAKKLEFLRALCEKLGLKNVTLLCGRAEELGRDRSLRERFDGAVSRAVAPLPMLCELCMPFVRVGGIFAPHKGARAESELAASHGAVGKLGGRLGRGFNYRLAPEEPESHVLRIEKRSPCPPELPRAFARIKTRPL